MSSMARMYKAALREAKNGSISRIAFWVAGAWTVRAAETAPAAGFTVCGLKVQVPPAGKPEHARPRTCANPFFGVTVIVSLPEAPCATVSDELLIDNE